MEKISRFFIAVFIIFVLFGSFFTHEAQAASLGNLKDTITTSRPSAASPLTANATSGVGQLSIANNGSRYLASDSAKIIQGTGTISNNNLIVSSQSAALTSVYLGNITTAFAGAGSDVLIVPITARHTITFNTTTTIPASGTIVVTFPGSGINAASPSASTFAFNNLVTGNVTATGTGVVCSAGTLVVAAPSITCTTSTLVAAGTAVTITIGSTTPALINPTKTAAEGVSDPWTIAVRTTDASLNTLDNGSTRIATIESVQVQATVEPTLTFIITGVTNGTNINTISASCGSIPTNAGLATTPTAVNLGVLSNGYVSAAAQQLSVSTNAATGYVITATSSGQFKNPATGFVIFDANGGTGLTNNDTPVPAVIAAGTPAFGIHACGARSGALSGSSGITAGDIWINAGVLATARFSNPWNTGTNAFYATIASYTGGPVNSDLTAILYGATISGTTPAGIYQTTLTYVATGTF